MVTFIFKLCINVIYVGQEDFIEQENETSDKTFINPYQVDQVMKSLNAQCLALYVQEKVKLLNSKYQVIIGARHVPWLLLSNSHSQ